MKPPSASIRAIARNFGWIAASRGLMGLLSIGYLAILTRSLGVTGFGRFALIAGAAQTLSTLVAFQSWQVIVAYGAAPLAANDDDRLARLFQASALLDVVGAVVGVLIAWAILHFGSSAFGIGPALERAALIFAIINVVSVRSTPLGILRLRDRFALAAAADSVTSMFRLLGAIIVLFVHPTVQGFLAVWGAAELLTAAAFWWQVGRSGDLRLMLRARDVRRVTAECPGILRFALSTNASATLGLATKQAPLLFVGAALGTAAAGSFRLAGQIAQALAKFAQLLSRAAFPEVVKGLRDRPSHMVRPIAVRAILVSLVAAAAIMLLVAVLGQPILALIGGQRFPHSYGILMFMAAAGCLEFTTIALDTIMTARSRAGTVFLIRALGVAVIFALARPLIARFDANGMAAAVLAGSLATMLAMAAYCFVRTPVTAEAPR